MRRYRIGKDRGKLQPAVLIVAILIVAFFLIRMITLSFSKEIGQAKKSFSQILITKLSIHVIESGSSLISYKARGDVEKMPLPVSILADQLVLHEYTKDSRSLQTLLQNKINGQGNSFVMNNQTYEESRLISQGDKVTPTQGEISSTNSGTDQDKGYNSSEVGKGRIHFRNITEGKLPREYILTNGAAFDDKTFQQYVASGGIYQYNNPGQLSVGILDGDLANGEVTDYSQAGEGSAMETFAPNKRINYTLDQLKDINFLIRNFYFVDPDTRVTDGLFDVASMLSKDMTIKHENDVPQILIYHTHSQEAFLDSRENVVDDTVVGIGTYLEEILEEQYGYNVIHDTGIYDLVNGVANRNKAYNYALESISKILEENPTIEVVIDLHRDGVAKRSTVIDGKETAQIMLYNGLSRDLDGPLTNLDNPNLQDNLAFSLQLQLKANDKYPGFFYGNYLKSPRYNLHVRPKSILVELGTYKNTVQSAKNAMEPFAEVLNAVLKGE